MPDEANIIPGDLIDDISSAATQPHEIPLEIEQILGKIWVIS